MADERSMFLLVTPSGGKLWRFAYRRPGSGKQNQLSLGRYPDVSLKRAREKRDEARRLLADRRWNRPRRQAESRSTCERGYLRGRRARVVCQVLDQVGQEPRRQGTRPTRE
ncbi:Arm DNA-binding domain-containing protein [Rudaea sp.]|uniref:Arm DNA-binding domain-containing protein n=1 Tax=Rudaea sp. TaxID=2136325 RepID=UPI0039E71E30